ncbi:hypothetical protein AVEN_35685-1 [Araneus ventricosus]|uniref:Uncharacterized protein n=1 Tax=Araneus ventricosus TaxID=182803 RepID=A0A4Y2X9F7_ARAVE|nr:hypothetical protein AVEN_35685-1 [Araneus ventricosus]
MRSMTPELVPPSPNFHATPAGGRLAAIVGLFWGGSRNFEQRADDEDDTWASAPSPSFHATPAGERLAAKYDLACSRPHTRRIFSGIGFRAWNSPVPEPRPYH